MSWISRLFALVVMAGALVATGARAQVITPNPTTFTVSGVMNFEAWPSCTYTMTFDVPTGGASATVTNATVTGGDNNCEGRTFTGLPWSVRVGPQMLHIDNFEMLFGPGYPTGKQTIDVYWASGGGYPSGGSFYAYIGLYGTLGYMQVTSGQPVAIN